MKVMRYMIITNDYPFYSQWLLEPDWNNVVMIIDILNDVYVRWENDNNKGGFWDENLLVWQEINFDHL